MIKRKVVPSPPLVHTNNPTRFNSPPHFHTQTIAPILVAGASFTYTKGLGKMHLVVCLMTGPRLLPKRILHTVRSSVSSLNFHHPLVSLRSSSSCLRLLLRLPVISMLRIITLDNNKFIFQSDTTIFYYLTY